ncbi:hypothetical protein GGTG_06633 [Gaeumannomyces tritici R3-111a-1]|uniref:Serine protease n=1 Tax=Gaeumannomyces tritici (strain R3-111a-1) TaxID=644352 RepID=J3NZD4_GAET3|nr:hypothetical protein GGTG_06633 [Gaeumannomyces tritici R3-111a-1]EJT76717.1 hypothetical protein GGTG_06633 [Gaeumannomyces tritici R3-111a-1]
MSDVSTADWHRSWRDVPVAEEQMIGLKEVDPENCRKWVVKLRFRKHGEGNVSWGTGFFLNLPVSPYSVILTAGHNLISESGQPVEDLTILRDTGPNRPVNHSTEVKVCSNYKAQPRLANRVNDYGAILLNKDASQGGFGFSTALGSARSITPEIFVTGHHAGTATGSPSTNSGIIKHLLARYLRYKVDTICGNSDGPVWVAYGGCETAIAIQNCGADSLESPNDLSQGTRINADVLRDVCEWAGIGYFSKSLRVSQLGSPTSGLYLRLFDEYTPGRVRLGPEDLYTVFDIIPAMTPSGVTDDTKLDYVFRFHKPSGKPGDSDEDRDSDEESDRAQRAPNSTAATGDEAPLWVRWRPELSRVELSSEFRDDCLVKLIPERDAYRIQRGEFILRMGDDEIPKVPPEGRCGFYSLYESSEVTFMPLKDEVSNYPYYLFALE